MARTKQAIVLGLRDDRARQVGALLAVRDEHVLPLPNQNAAIGRLRIQERDGAADRNVREARNARDLGHAAAAAEPVLRRNPELSGRECEACQDHELHEVAARHVEILWRIDREIAPPFRLRVERTPVGGSRDLLTVHHRPVKADRGGPGQTLALGRVDTRVDRVARIVILIQTSTSLKGSATTFNEIERLVAVSCIAAVTSTSGCALDTRVGTMIDTRVVIL